MLAKSFARLKRVNPRRAPIVPGAKIWWRGKIQAARSSRGMAMAGAFELADGSGVRRQRDSCSLTYRVRSPSSDGKSKLQGTPYEPANVKTYLSTTNPNS